MTPATSTATVTIRTLTVDGNHLTRAVWGQVPHRPLLTDDGGVDGTPWGTVNLHPDCDSPAGHLHVAYTHQDALYQATVLTTPEYPPATSEAGELLFQRCVSAQLHGREVDYLTGQAHIEHGVAYEFTQTTELALALKTHQDLTKERGSLAKVHRDHERYGGATKRIAKQEKIVARAEDVFTGALAALDASLADAPPIEILYERFTTEARSEADRRQCADQDRKQLLALPQLYILGGGQ